MLARRMQRSKSFERIVRTRECFVAQRNALSHENKKKELFVAQSKCWSHKRIYLSHEANSWSHRQLRAKVQGQSPETEEPSSYQKLTLNKKNPGQYEQSNWTRRYC